MGKHNGTGELLKKLAGRRVVVAGDVMLDEYLHGGARRVSPEAPVLVVEVDRVSWAPGGAANVAANIKALGGEVSIIGLIGCDEAGRRLSDQLSSMGIDVSGLLEDRERHTTLKTRIMAGNQQVVRVDREKRDKPGRSIAKKMQDLLTSEIDRSDAIVISDYNKGMIGQITQDALHYARRQGKVFTSNPKPPNLRWFHNAPLITLNQVEAEAASSEHIESPASLERAGRHILDKTDGDNLIITRGSQGLSVFTRDGITAHIPVMPVEVYDVAGAGDTVVSALTLGLAAGGDLVEAARLANYAAASVVRKPGVAAAVPEEISHLIFESEEH